GGLQQFLDFAAGTKPTALQVQNHLLSIPALNPVDPITLQNVPSVTVMGKDGGPFTIIFNNKLALTQGIAVTAATTASPNNNTVNITQQDNNSSLVFPVSTTVSTAATAVSAVDIETPVTPSVNTE